MRRRAEYRDPTGDAAVRRVMHSAAPQRRRVPVRLLTVTQRALERRERRARATPPTTA